MRFHNDIKSGFCTIGFKGFSGLFGWVHSRIGWIRSSGIGFVFQGLDWFFRDWIRFSGTGLVFQGVDSFSGYDRSFGYWTGL